MSSFTYEIANVITAVQRAHPNDPEGAYAVPWYLLLGHPGSGRTTALQAMNLTWNNGEGPINTGAPEPKCTYWLPREALFIEPEATVLGPNRAPENLKELCAELKVQRPRESLDGVIVVISIADFIDLDERALEDYANGLRRYMVEVGQALGADAPTYIVLTRYEVVWGFAEVFQWTPERKREDPWGFTLPPDTPSQDSQKAILAELDGLNARIEGFCIAKLSSEDPPEQRIRAFQHLAEIRALTQKLKALFTVIAMANAFERAPWIRAVALGSALPGSGDRLRAGVSRFFNMGLGQGQAAPASQRPGGMPLHAYMSSVILPERDIVPTKKRWRDDTIIVICALAAALFWFGTMVTGIVFAATSSDGPVRPPVKAAPAKK